MLNSKADARERENAAKRARRATDPEYRERKNAADRARYCARSNPEYRERKNAARRAKLASPEARKRRSVASRARNRAKLSGWPTEVFDFAWEYQGGRCAICAVAMLPTGVSKSSVTADHCYATETPRELLCRNCNTGLGLFKDDPARLEKAAMYLRHHTLTPQMRDLLASLVADYQRRKKTAARESS
jgi:hypothetical protein